MNEASLYDENVFITLTYDHDRLPDGFDGRSLCREHVQRFLKRLRDHAVRRRGRSFRFYGCGEYGERFGRPHYHLCLFDMDFSDKTHWRTTESGHRLYRSELLEAVWPYGMSEIGSVTFDSAGYVARYCLKKITGDLAKEHYHYLDDEGRSRWRVPEFPMYSNRPGIGIPWLKKFQTDVYNYDYVSVAGRHLKPPRAYDKQFELEKPGDMERLRKQRRKENRMSRDERMAEATYDRFAAKEEISLAKLSLSSPRKVE